VRVEVTVRDRYLRAEEGDRVRLDVTHIFWTDLIVSYVNTAALRGTPLLPTTLSRQRQERGYLSAREIVPRYIYCTVVYNVDCLLRSWE